MEKVEVGTTNTNIALALVESGNIMLKMSLGQSRGTLYLLLLQHSFC